MHTSMTLPERIEANRDLAFDLLRIYLGVGLFVRGLFFLIRPDAFTALVAGSEASLLASSGVMYIVVCAHLLGGAMITVGLFTRLAVLLQVPILLGAVFLVHLRGGVFTAGQSLEFSALVLFLLIPIFLHGSGRWSVDASWSTRRFVPFRSIGEQFERLGNIAFELLRIYLGIGLFARGVLFISNSSAFIDLLGPSSSAWLTSVVLIHYVALSHLVGGVMIAVGLFTRVAALVQLPILIGAVFVVHMQSGFLAATQSLEFSALVLFLLILLVLWGSGRLSVDKYIVERPADAEHYRHAQALDKEATEAEPLLPSEYSPPPAAACSCGHGRDHPRVSPHVRYGMFSAVFFLAGATGPPKEIVFRCGNCGEVVTRSREPEVLRRHRYQR
ncbi:MAG: DoxX family membrane protein [Bacteroidetes bacterium SB0662_bin_6]|nr:DoxX family membrane protein [Bacteroidetes bacterium SB0662_bin_6]